MTIALSDIRRYPVKGMSGETLDAVDVIAGEALPHGRRFALANGSSGFNRAAPGWMPKNHFLNLSRDEKLAQLAVHFDPETTTLTVERGGRQPMDPLRFRANLTVTGAERWEERDWIGYDLAIGEARLRVEEPIERCAATNVDPNTATRDMNIPMVLERGFGHVEFGVYARVTTPGTIRPGDAITFIR